MNDDFPITFTLPSVCAKKVTAAFDGGRLSSDSGVMLLALAERRRGLADTLASLITDPRDPGDLTVGDNFQKHSYPWGIMINANGERFLDEGSDFRNYTYAKNGRIILMQPKQFCYQVFDNKIIPMLRDEYPPLKTGLSSRALYGRLCRDPTGITIHQR